MEVLESYQKVLIKITPFDNAEEIYNSYTKEGWAEEISWSESDNHCAILTKGKYFERIKKLI